MKAIEARLGMAMTLLMVLDKGRKGNAWAWLDRDLGPGSEQVHIPRIDLGVHHASTACGERAWQMEHPCVLGSLDPGKG